jgi:hypothetical protein
MGGHGMSRWSCLLVVAAVALPQGSSAQQATSPVGDPVPVEFSTHLDLGLRPSGMPDLDPAQVLFCQPRPVSYLLRNGALDFAPATEGGEDPDLQVDALANTYDGQFDEVIGNEADLVVSLGPDPFTVDQTDQPSELTSPRSPSVPTARRSSSGPTATWRSTPS